MSRATTPQNSIAPRAALLRRAAIWIGALLCLTAAPAHANRILQVRVGNHPTYTRLVFEMESFAGYQVQRAPGSDASEQLTVTIEASTPPREIQSKSIGIESVSVAEGAGKAIAQIRLRKPGLQMKEMILSNPPRIVLDFVHSAEAIQAMSGDPYAKPAPVAVDSKPKPQPAVAPKPEPVVAKVEPLPVVVEPKPEPAVVEIAKLEPSADADPSLAAEEERRKQLRDSIPGVHKRDELVALSNSAADSALDESAGMLIDESAEALAADEDVADAGAVAPELPLGTLTQDPIPPAAEEQPTAANSQEFTRIPKPASAESKLPLGMLALAGIAIGTLVSVVAGVRLFRRRSLPQDLDVTTFADASDDVSDDDAESFARHTSDRIPARESSMDASPIGGRAPKMEEQNTAAYSLSEVAANQTEPGTGLFNDDSEGEKPMDMRTSDLPADRDEFSMPHVGMSDGDSGEISRLVQELANRVATLETRLDEANDSRERLERQVAAQSEELRVQRAAIARTQRALRSLSRAEEDQATEPALREPSQPAR